MDDNTLKKLHNVMLEIIDDFVSLCKENNFTYFLAGGTLLGAVRHNGFIPWDDDVDIIMPRNDYEKLLKLFKDDDNPKYYILSRKSPITTYYNYLPYAKLCKKGTVFAESYRKNPDDYSGIFIDIFPFDNSVPIFLRLQASLIEAAKRLYRLKMRFDIPKNKIKLFIIKRIRFLIPLKLSRSLQLLPYLFFNGIKTKYISVFSGIFDFNTETHKRDMIFPLSKQSFEGRELNIPKDWDFYLKKYYNNYMELPPIEQRKTHEPLFIKFGDEEQGE